MIGRDDTTRTPGNEGGGTRGNARQASARARTAERDDRADAGAHGKYRAANVRGSALREVSSMTPRDGSPTVQAR